MPTFDRVSSREQRAVACDRIGTNRALSDVWYNTTGKNTTSSVDRLRGLVSFDSSSGHLPVADLTTSGDAHYDARSAYERLHRPRGVVSFGRMSSRKSIVQFERRDPVKMTCGGSPEVAHADMHFRFARPLTQGSDYCDFDKYVTRKKREIVGYFASPMPASVHAPALNVSHSAVECKLRGSAAWRPSSAGPIRRPMNIDSCAEWKEAEFTEGERSRTSQSMRPASAASNRPASASSSFASKSHRGAVRSDEVGDPLASFFASRRSLARNSTFSKAPRVT